MGANDLKPRQYKRIARISESNPERASRVLVRMNKRDDITQTGNSIAAGRSQIAKSQTEYSKKYDEKRASLASGTMSQTNLASGRDYPLSPTPTMQKSKPFTEAKKEQKSRNKAVNDIKTVIQNTKAKKI